MSEPAGFLVTSGRDRGILAAGPASILGATTTHIVVTGHVVHSSEALP